MSQTHSDTDDFLASALLLSSKGVPVFPLKRHKGTPAIKGWIDKATTDETTIRRWWMNKFAGCNVGVACQQTIIVLDIDRKNSKDGTKALKQLIRQGLPKTLTVRTHSGGAHLYYQHPGGYVKGVIGYWPGIDIRGNRGLAVGPGSVTDKGMYKFVDPDVPIAQWPDFIDLPFKQERQEPIGFSMDESSTDAMISDAGSQYTSLPDVIPMGGRDDFLFKAACSWRERGYARAHAELLMQAFWERCEQKAGDEYTLDAALAKLEQAWTNYSPADSWHQVVTPQGRTIVAPQKEIKNIKEAIARFVFITEGNRVADMERAPHRAVMKLEEFKNTFRNVYIGKNTLPIAWIGNRSRQTVRDTGYWPGKGAVYEEYGDDVFNTYADSMQELPEELDYKKIKPFFDHIRYLLNDEKAVEKLVNWCAVTVQMPWERIPWMPLIITPPRCGKGLLFKTISKMVGRQNTSKVSSTELEDIQYNSWISNVVVTCIEELKTSRRWDITEKLKELITEDEIDVNHKHGKKGKENIFTNFMAFSNHTNAAHLTADDARFWVVGSRCKRQPGAYYKAYKRWLDSDGPAHLELFMRSYDISKFDWAQPPDITEAKREMIDSSMAPFEQDLMDAIDDREGPFKADIVDCTLAEQFMESKKGHLTDNDRLKVREVLGNASNKLPQIRYRVTLSPSIGSKRYRLRVLRNTEFWESATRFKIQHEFKRAWLSANGHDTPPQLEEVSSNDDRDNNQS